MRSGSKDVFITWRELTRFSTTGMLRKPMSTPREMLSTRRTSIPGWETNKKKERESLRRSSRSICLHYRLDTHYTLRPDAAAASAEGAEVKQNRVIVPGWREAAGQRLFACSNYGDLERRTHSYTSLSPAQLRRQVVCLDSSRPVQVFSSSSSSSLDRL